MTENKKTNSWKITAIIFIILFALETLVMIWGMILVQEEEEKTAECYYDICEDYPQAYFLEDVCYCYDYDQTDELVVVEEKYMK